jgi:hypothetical protein
VVVQPSRQIMAAAPFFIIPVRASLGWWGWSVEHYSTGTGSRGTRGRAGRRSLVAQSRSPMSGLTPLRNEWQNDWGKRKGEDRQQQKASLRQLSAKITVCMKGE